MILLDELYKRYTSIEIPAQIFTDGKWKREKKSPSDWIKATRRVVHQKYIRFQV